MKKIGIMTFHKAYNYGAFLQSYSLQKKVNSIARKSKTEIIDYCSQNMMDYYKTDIKSIVFGNERFSFSSIRKYLSNLKQLLINSKYDKKYIKHIRIRNNMFEDVYYRLNLSERRCISDEWEEIKNFLKQQNYDVIIVGSDAVWNDYQTCLPNPYYLDSEMSAYKLSYAASSYGMDYTVKSSKESELILKKVKDFRYIGVRDLATHNYMKKIGITSNIYHNCDPSIFLDLNEKEFDREKVKLKLQSRGVDFERPLYGIMGENWLGAIVREMLGEDAQIVSLYIPNKYSDMWLYDLNPFEWAVVFSFFTATFTHFFHGTIFSLKNLTLTFCVEWQGDYAQKYDTKIQDLLKRLDLTDLYFTKEQVEKDYSILFEKMKENLGNQYEYKQRVKHAIENEEKYAESFLNVLKDCLEVKEECKNNIKD